jgi:hypothetical protein
MDNFLANFSVDILAGCLPATTAQNVDASKIYVAEYVDGRLYRAKVVSAGPETVRVHFMDYGNTDDVSYSKMFQAKDLDPTMAKLRPLV